VISAEESISNRKASGVRALALDENGNLVDDFIFDSNEEWKNVLHVRNAPSPAATASLAIGSAIVDKAQLQFKL
jgi:L-2-hydroxyglutarate oxidase LhgO